MEYKISIVIPVYNAEKYLKECIESIKKQTIGFENLQVILVNDGSTDSSKQIIDDFANENNNVLAIHLERSHFIGGFARNEGIKYAEGEYLMFLDSDDRYTERSCELMYNAAINNKVNIVTGNYRCMFEDGRLWENATFDSKKYKSDFLEKANEKFFYLYCPSACMKIFKTKLIKENNIEFLDNIPGEDAFFSTNALMKCDKVYYLSDEIYNYRRRDTGNISTSWMRNIKYFRGINSSFRRIFELFKENNKIEYYRYFYAKNFISIIYKFIDSKLISYEERKIIVDEMYWFFEHSKTYNIVFPQKTLMILLDYILAKDYKNIIKCCEVIAETRNFMTCVERDKMAKPQKIILESNYND